MNKRRVEKMILAAMDILNEDNDIKAKLFTQDKRAVKSVFNGYISSFGPCVVQAGLLQSLMFFSRTDGEGKDRQWVVKLMRESLDKAHIIKDMPEKDDLQKIVRDKLKASKTAQERAQLKNLILEASVAAKLAMRTFPKYDEEKENGGK